MYSIKKSEIHGKGIIADRSISEGVIIGEWITLKPDPDFRRLSDHHYETDPIGRYCNHSDSPNTEIMTTVFGIYLVSKGIDKDEEITVDYRIAENITGYPAMDKINGEKVN